MCAAAFAWSWLLGDTPSTAAPNYTCIVYCHGPSAHRNRDDYRGTWRTEHDNTSLSRDAERRAVRLAAGVFAGCTVVVVTRYLAGNASFGLLQHFRRHEIIGQLFVHGSVCCLLFGSGLLSVSALLAVYNCSHASCGPPKNFHTRLHPSASP